MKCGEWRNQIQDISEEVSFVEFLRETSCPLRLTGSKIDPGQ